MEPFTKKRPVDILAIHIQNKTAEQPQLEKSMQGDNIQISIQSESDEETDRLFNRLSAGGQITMPLEKTFWGARFGMCIDKFSIHWMINQDINPDE